MHLQAKATTFLLPRWLTGRVGALIAWCAAVAQVVAILTQELAYAQVGRNRPDLLAVNLANVVASWMFVGANLGLSFVVLSAAATAVRRFPLAACTGAFLLLASHVLLNVDYLGMTTNGGQWLCKIFGLEGVLGELTLIGDVTQTCLLFVLDWLQVFGGALFGSLFWQLDRSGRPAAYAFFAFSAWAVVDLVFQVIMPVNIGSVSDIVFAGLSIAQCVTVAIYLAERARREQTGRMVAANDAPISPNRHLLEAKSLEK